MKTIISDIKQQRSSLCAMIDNILALSGMMKGSFGATYRRCGKPTCWCANPDVKGHPCTKLMWVDEEGSKTRAVKDEDKQTVVEAIEQYHEYKKLRQNFRDQSQLLLNLLGAYESAISVESRTRLGYDNHPNKENETQSS